MRLEDIKAYCLNKWKAYEDYPFGDIPICYKLNGKVFAQIYPKQEDFKITLKCTAECLVAESYGHLLGGTMGVGKTTTCQILENKLPNCVFLDGDWCWDMQPVRVTPETKKMVMENICFLLNQLIRCSIFENIVFCWVMHEQSIIDQIISKLEPEDWQIHIISLICDGDVLRRHLQKDIDAGIRSEDVIQRSIARIDLYEKLDTEKIDVTHRTPEQVAERIINEERGKTNTEEVI